MTISHLPAMIQVPVRRRLFPAMPPCSPKRARGFLFASNVQLCYVVQQLPRTGKLRATETFRNLPAWPHRSNEKVAHAAVSCVGWLRRKCRAGADTLQWLSGMGSLPADRQHLTNAHAVRTANNSGQRRPSTRLAKHRKVQRISILRTSCTKDARLGLTDGLDCYCSDAKSRAEAVGLQYRRRPNPLLARHGGGVRHTSAYAFFQVAIAILLLLEALA
jgi:hypothetical protein